MLYYPEIEILKFPVEPHPSRLVECQQDKANWGSIMIVTSLWEQQILLKIFFSWSSVGKLYPDNKIIRTYANQNKNRNKNIKRQTENDVRKPIWRLLDHSGYFFLFFWKWMPSWFVFPEVPSLHIDLQALSQLGNFKAQFNGERVPEL